MRGRYRDSAMEVKSQVDGGRCEFNLRFGDMKIKYLLVGE